MSEKNWIERKYGYTEFEQLKFIGYFLLSLSLFVIGIILGWAFNAS